MPNVVISLDSPQSAPIEAKPGKSLPKVSSQDKMIETALMHERELKTVAKAKGHLRKDGTIDQVWLEQMAQGDDVTAQRARLSLTLSEMKNLKSYQSDKGV